MSSVHAGTAGRLRAARPALGEALALVRLALPLVLSSIVSMAMSITDVVMMGWLGTTALAAGASASDYYSLVYYLGAGVVAALCPAVARALGAGDHAQVRAWVQQGVRLALLVALPCALAVWHADLALSAAGVVPEVVAMGAPYARWMALTCVLMLVVSVWHHVLSAHGLTRLILAASVLVLPVNAALNYVLMFGAGPLPAMGLAGAGLGSALATLLMCLVLGACVMVHPALARHELLRHWGCTDWSRIGALARVGLPIGIANLAELGVFMGSTIVMGIIGTGTLAAHAVAIRMAGLLFAFPLGLSQAATVRVAHAAGAGDRAAMARAARVAVIMSLLIGAVFLAALLQGGQTIVNLFLDPASAPPQVLSQALLLLLVLAVVQPVDTLNTVVAGVLRGVQDTRVPMLVSLVAHWVCGFAGALVLAFALDLGGLGIWLGLATGTLVATIGVSWRLWRLWPHRFV